MVTVALKLITPGPAVFQVQDGSLIAVTPVTWTVWSMGRVYPPEGTYWVEFTPDANLEKRGSETVKLTSPQVVRFTDGDHLTLQFKQDGQAIRISPA